MSQSPRVGTCTQKTAGQVRYGRTREETGGEKMWLYLKHQPGESGDKLKGHTYLRESRGQEEEGGDRVLETGGKRSLSSSHFKIFFFLQKKKVEG